VPKAMNRKVVDLTTLYNFQKGHIVFFSTDLMSTRSEKQENLSCKGFSTIFHPKFEMPIYMKVVSSTRWTTFVKVDFEVLR
jgi:hypothetical protein